MDRAGIREIFEGRDVGSVHSAFMYHAGWQLCFALLCFVFLSLLVLVLSLVALLSLMELRRFSGVFNFATKCPSLVIPIVLLFVHMLGIFVWKNVCLYI